MEAAETGLGAKEVNRCHKSRGVVHRKGAWHRVRYPFRGCRFANVRNRVFEDPQAEYVC